MWRTFPSMWPVGIGLYRIYCRIRASLKPDILQPMKFYFRVLPVAGSIENCICHHLRLGSSITGFIPIHLDKGRPMALMLTHLSAGDGARIGGCIKRIATSMHWATTTCREYCWQ